MTGTGLILATRNTKKLAELRRILEASHVDVSVADLSEYPDMPEVAETGTTFTDNALLKARADSQLSPKDVPAMSEALRNSAGSIGTVSDISAYREEIEKLIAGTAPPTVVATDSAVGDPGAFAMEKHLEDFLVLNWAQTDFGKDYDLYSVLLHETGHSLGLEHAQNPADVMYPTYQGIRRWEAQV